MAITRAQQAKQMLQTEDVVEDVRMKGGQKMQL